MISIDTLLKLAAETILVINIVVSYRGRILYVHHIGMLIDLICSVLVYIEL